MNMHRMLCSLAMAFLLLWSSRTVADESTEPTGTPSASAAGPAQPSAARASTYQAASAADRIGEPRRANGLTMVPAQAPTAAKPSEAPQPKVESQPSSPAWPAGADPAEAQANSLIPVIDPALLKLKAQIKSVRLSLAETTGRLIVTDKNLSSSTVDVERLRSENTSLREGLAKAETVAKKAEEEVAVRRQEMRILEGRGGAGGSGATGLGLILALAVSLLLAIAVFGQGKRLRTMLAALSKPKADESRQEQLRAQLRDEQQKAQRLEEECKRLREASNRTTATMTSSGGKGAKPEQLRRELRDLRAAAEDQKRAAEARVQALEAEVQKLSDENRQLDGALNRATDKLVFLGHDEVEETTSPSVD